MPRNMCLKTRQKKRTEDWPAWRNIAGKKVKIENLSSKSNELTPDQRDRPQFAKVARKTGKGCKENLWVLDLASFFNIYNMYHKGLLNSNFGNILNIVLLHAICNWGSTVKWSVWRGVLWLSAAGCELLLWFSVGNDNLWIRGIRPMCKVY